MTFYECPLCHQKIDRELTRFLDHTNQHIIDRIKEQHPEWVEADGACEACAEYYQKELSGEAKNIGPLGRRRRFILGLSMLVISLVLALLLPHTHVNRIWRVSLFAPLFLGFLGLMEAQQKTCALLSELGMRDFDKGSQRISDDMLLERLKARGRNILFQSALFALVGSVLFLFYP
ncbi:MAG: hypothetical protein HY447_05575 [Candidatus Omnitrophica bacterium]|nr:hypothetical protein [Candidatus Omnitrophota bacterium]